MRKFTLFLICAISTVALQAQESSQYNKWSIDVMGGLSKPSRPYTDNYYSPTFGAWNADLGLRYMINEKFGLKLNAGYNNIEEGEDVAEFQTKYYHATLEGVINLGSVLNFRQWTNTFNLLAHGGAGIGRIDLDENVVFAEEEDYQTTFAVGVTPQVKLGKHLALVGDLSLYGNVNQDYTWDGNTKTPNRGFDGMVVNASIGLNIYLGGADKHADWVANSENEELKSQLDSLQNRLSTLETDLQDEDQDGVPNYLDREPNTMNGVAVDTKGHAIDKNGNGIPDEIESSLDERYTSKQESTQLQASAIKELLNNGYVNVYFKFDSVEPEKYSYEALNYLVNYMKANPEVKAELIGYADEIGNSTYNQELSERRAKKVYDLAIASGVDASRLEFKGNGIDDSVDKSSSEARQIVRRVTFRIK